MPRTLQPLVPVFLVDIKPGSLRTGVKQDIEIPEAFSNKTKQHIHILYAEFGNDKFFGRTEVMNMLEITASPASELIKKMLESELICHIKGKGKGKYLFKRT